MVRHAGTFTRLRMQCVRPIVASSSAYVRARNIALEYFEATYLCLLVHFMSLLCDSISVGISYLFFSKSTRSTAFLLAELGSAVA